MFTMLYRLYRLYMYMRREGLVKRVPKLWRCILGATALVLLCFCGSSAFVCMRVPSQHILHDFKDFKVHESKDEIGVTRKITFKKESATPQSVGVGAAALVLSSD